MGKGAPRHNILVQRLVQGVSISRPSYHDFSKSLQTNLFDLLERGRWITLE
jgi:hypothetical protein